MTAQEPQPSEFIALRDVEFAYPTATSRQISVLNRISLTLRPGDFVAILGPSGCGKSTLLRILAGLLEPSKGHRTVADPDLLLDPLLTSMNFQTPVLLPWLTLEENAFLPYHLARRTIPSQVKSRLAQLLNLVGLQGFLHALPHELSGGMQMRAALVRAFLPEPRLLLMDEPFAALDEATRSNLGRQFRSLARQSSAGVVFVTHSIREAALLADRVIVLSPRPARIIDELEVRLPEKRDDSVRRTPDYLDLCDALEAIIAHD